MNIVIGGDGQVALHVAKWLINQGHSITVIGSRSEVLKTFSTENDVMPVVGDITNPSVLKEANVGDCDLYVAVLHEESANLLSCMMAKKLKAKHTVARVINTDLLEGENRDNLVSLGVDELFCPERIAAKEIVNMLDHFGTAEYFALGGGLLGMYLVKLEENAPVVGHSVSDLVQIYKSLEVRIVAVGRNGSTQIPHSDFVSRAGDLAYMVSRHKQIDRVMKAAGKTVRKVNSVMIAGGGRIARLVAHELEDNNVVKIVEIDHKRCEQLNNEMKNTTTIICGDAADLDLMKREGLDKVDAFIALSNSTEVNIMSALQANSLQARLNRSPITIALVEKTGFVNLSQNIGIEAIVNKKAITASYIAHLIVKGEGVRVKSLIGTEAELIEIVVAEGSVATQKPLGELNMPKNSTVGGIIRGNSAIMPTRDVVFEEGDHVVIFAFPGTINDAVKLFNKKN